MDQRKKKLISKRDFIKTGLLGSCGIACGLVWGRSMANSLGNGNINVHTSMNNKLWKWQKEAAYYIATPRGIKCQLCPQACILEDGETGDCRTNVCEGDKLYSITYGNPCAVHVDPIEKKPLYHFLPSSLAFSIATAGCNLACLNCQNWEISQSSPKETRNYDLMPSKTVEKAREFNCETIAYTYSDPVAFYEYTLDTAKIARMEGIKNCIVSAGYINEEPLKEWCKYIDAANIDLKSFSNEIYEMLNAGTLEPVLDSLKILKSEGVWLEITNLIVPTWTDDMDMIKKMCDWLYANGFKDNPLHFSKFHPMYKLTNLPGTPLATLESAKKIAEEAGLKYVYVGNVPGIGGEDTICPACKKIIVNRKGYKIIDIKINDGKCALCGERIAGVW